MFSLPISLLTTQYILPEIQLSVRRYFVLVESVISTFLIVTQISCDNAIHKELIFELNFDEIILSL